MSQRISVVTPTLGRPQEVAQLLANLARQEAPPFELLLVDASPDDATADVVAAAGDDLPFARRYYRATGGTAIQRNYGIDRAAGDYIAFIDDDIRLEADFFRRMLEAFAEDVDEEVGGVAGYITNQFLDPETSPRWRWYRRLHLFSTYEPGRYDYKTGYPINRYLQPPHDGLRQIDFMGSNCALWRRVVFEKGLRFSEFFAGYGILEDAHLALRASREWRLLENGKARCQHLRSPRSRVDKQEVARKSAVNYRYVFIDMIHRRSLAQEVRFWLVQLLDLARMLAFWIRHPQHQNWMGVVGKTRGILQAARMWKSPEPTPTP